MEVVAVREETSSCVLSVGHLVNMWPPSLPAQGWLGVSLSDALYNLNLWKVRQVWSLLAFLCGALWGGPEGQGEGREAGRAGDFLIGLLQYLNFCLFLRVSQVSMQGGSHLLTLRRSMSTSTTTSLVKNLPRRLWQWLCTTITRGSTTTYQSTKRWIRWRNIICLIVAKSSQAGSTRNGRADKRKVPSYAQVGM